MTKAASILLVLFAAGCVDPVNEDAARTWDGDETEDDGDGQCLGTPEECEGGEEDDPCAVGALDQAPANLDDSDGKVTFCHATSSATNPFVVITTSVRACTAHEKHRKLPKGGFQDAFPTGGCRD